MISHHRRILLSSPRSYPWRSLHLRALAGLYNNRWVQSNQEEEEDLNRSILYFTEAIFVASPWDRSGQDTVVQGLNLLAIALRNRLLLFNQSSDAQYCVEYFRYLLSQPLEAFGVSCGDVKFSLVTGLASQVELGIGDAAQNIDEMAVHCLDLLASNIPQSLSVSAVTTLIEAANNVYDEATSGSAYPEEMIQCLREANRRFDSHKFADKLAIILFHRFQETNLIDDFEEAMALFDRTIASESNTDCPAAHVQRALHNAASLAHERARIYESPEHIEEAIYRHRAFLRVPWADDIHRRYISEKLATLMRIRSGYFGITEACTEEGLPEESSLDGDAASFSRLSESLLSRSITDKTCWWAEPKEQVTHLRALLLVCRSRNIPEVAEAIVYCQLLLALSSPSHPITFHPANALAQVLLHAFECTNNMEFLDKSIAAFYDILEMPSAEHAHFHAIEGLSRALSTRWMLSEDQKDFDELMQLYSRASKNPYASERRRLRITYRWAEHARHKGDQTTSTAYKTALSLMEDTLLLAPTLETQHFHLVALSHVYEKLPLDFASHEVNRGRLMEAIQALERGRGLLWAEMRGLRTSAGQLSLNCHLAEEFTAVNRELEALTMSVSPDAAMNDDDGLEGNSGMDKFGHLVVRHRKLLMKRNELVKKIQALPEFGGFLKTPSFDNLRSAAVHGPVIIVNHSEWRSDILIVHSDTHPSLITTSDDFYNRAIELRNRLVCARKDHALESRQYQRALRSVLESLYELVGQPVIKELQRLKIPEQSRIWWCPTSVFCSLPLHAMGPIASEGGISRYFSDIYIPSYTPTLSALIESRNPGKNPGKSSLEMPSVLLVASPDKDMENAVPEILHVQRLGAKVTTLMGERATPSAVVEGLHCHQFVHFVCHGILEEKKPFNASFKLSKGIRMTLLEIVQSRLPDAEFAFLSACHTAELTEGSIADEGLHLTAAVQYCGFRSVVGTMWAMADQDGGDLAKHFYNSMFSSNEPGVPYHERSAKALRDAVRSLRKEKRLPLEQWVNFVHYGA